MNSSHRPEPRARITTHDEAEALVVATLDILDELEPILIEETMLLRDGQMKAALILSEQKNLAAQRYQRILEDIKANAIALGRFTPPSLPLLREKHEAFAELMQLNMAVLGTAKTVSESIIRELAAEAGHARTPQGYGAYGRPASGYRTSAAPLAVSKSL